MIPIGSLYCYESKDTTTHSSYNIKAVGIIVMYQTAQNRLTFFHKNDSFLIVDFAEDMVFSKRYYMCVITDFKTSEVQMTWFEENTVGNLIRRSKAVV